MDRKRGKSSKPPATQADGHESGCSKDTNIAGRACSRIRLFLSSPGDVDAERQKVRTVVEQINRMLGEHLAFSLELVEWKTYVAPDMDRSQEVINRQINDYDIFAGIMWKRFGTPTGKAESGTEEEFNIAYANWQQFTRPRIMFYFSQAPYTPKNGDEIMQWGRVLAFKEKVQHKGLIIEYQTVEEFADMLRQHLAKVLIEWFSPKGKSLPIVDFNRYLSYLKEETMYINIRGLGCGDGKPYRFGIEQLYIPLKTTGESRSSKKSGRRAGLEHEELMPGEISLQEALQEAMHKTGLIIKGDPGAGKTTFLRLIAFILCQRWLGEEPGSGASIRFFWTEQQPPLPVFIRIGLFAEHISTWRGRNKDHVPVHEDSPEWLLHFLDEQSHACNWQLPAEVFRRELEAGHCLILLDGLDEAPNLQMREKISSLVTNLIRAYPDCQLVLTSRPGALAGQGMPEGNFALREIAPLDEQAMKTFLTQWNAALYPRESAESSRHLDELTGALQSRPEIRRMASTPVMLTALAVVHWNENRLPEQRAELYESIITWLLRAREQRQGRLSVDRCRKLLQRLALAMFTHHEGRQRQVGLGWAAGLLAPEFDPTREHTAVELATCFLHDEMLDSGIIVERSLRLEFWHLSFQEYLAACEINGLREMKQLGLLFENERLYSTEWREVVLLLSGVLYKQGMERINDLVDEIIRRGPKWGTHETLPQLAREVGLLGSIERDLSPYKYKPSNPAYPEIVRQVMGIFDKVACREIPVQVRIQAADALAQVGDPRFAKSDPRTGPMVEIPGGSFWMGAQNKDSKERNFDKNAYDDEAPVHQVKLSPYCIGKYPVTVGQYQRFIEDGGYKDKRWWEAGGFDECKDKVPDEWEDQKQYLSRPVVNLRWYEAAAYARWAGGRLPTEAEWERAARGPGQEYRKYPWGNEKPTPEHANFDDSGIGKVTPVGIFPDGGSPEGVLDMAGNVWEWCGSWYDKEKTGRVVRGGSFVNYQNVLRCACRSGGDPGVQERCCGFPGRPRLLSLIL